MAIHEIFAACGVTRMNNQKLNDNSFLKILPDRDPFAHKGDFGRVLMICGSVGYTGAPALSAMGALRSGAGLVFLCVPESIYTIEAVKLTEPIVYKLPDKDGRISIESISVLTDVCKNMDAVLIGPGLGQSEDVFSVVKWILENVSVPVILDADGINVICGHKDILRRRTGITVLTPHMGEFLRLLGRPCSDPRNAAVEIAEELGVILVLKGHNTLITDGNISYINSTGNPGMAVGGSGDVLAGIISSFLGQKISPVLAAAAAVYVHGKAGDMCAEELGQYGMLPTDMLQVLPRLLK